MSRKFAPFLSRQIGAALLTAMLTVTLVATFASAALWQQFRSFQVESAERSRLQSLLILTGALDWARLILREDTSAADHLAEPWAVPLEEARLSSFLAVDGLTGDSSQDAFLSGLITDQQGRLNVANLAEGEILSKVGVASFQRLFDRLDLPPETLAMLAENYLEASKKANGTATNTLPNQADFVLPQRVDQLVWLGLDAAALRVLSPHLTLLPTRTPVNLNTASALVLMASTPGLDMAGAEKLMAARARKHFSTLADAAQALGNPAVIFTDGAHGVSSRFFEVEGQLRLEDLTVFERSLVQRDGRLIRTLWRVRGVSNDLPARGNINRTPAVSGSAPRS